MLDDKANPTASDHWHLLRAGGHAGGGLEIPTIPSGVTADAGPVRLAMGPNGEPRVLLPLSEREAPTGIDGGPALSVTVSSFSKGRQALRFLDLICTSRELEKVFGEVVDEMLARIGADDTCAEAARSTIDDFRSLLTPARLIGIDKGKVAGLVAELLVLNRLLVRSPSAWKSWRGPMGDRHDFRAGDTSVEIKASLRADATSLTINGLQQLEAPSGGTLNLLHIVLEPVGGGMLSVSGLGRSAFSKADQPQKVRTMLAKLGCDDVDAEDWNAYAFRLEAENFYLIGDGFPRLVGSMLSGGKAPAGVSDISYEVDLSAAAACLCDTAAYAEVETRLCQ